ncbi:hypothetical protein ACFQ4Q_14045 [Lysobacter gummosus]|uniref:hypothetical protein n=1 Tax=Lysobacter gummosus TaxID=262324 RepID=UPI003642EA95
MPRQISEERLREYGDLKRFFEVWQTQLFPNQFFRADHPHHPVNALAAIEQRFGRSRALAGLKQAINDNLEFAVDFEPDIIARIDEVLHQSGAPTLTQLLAHQSKLLRAILRRGKIRNDTEFYIVSSVLSDTSADRPESETAALGSMSLAYEQKS